MPLSKQVSDFEKLATVVAATRSWANAAQAGTSEVLAPVLPAAGEVPLIDLFIVLVAERLLLEAEKVERADQVLALEVQDDPAARARRDQAIAELRGILIRIRRAVEGNYGSDGLVPLGIDGPTPRDAMMLARTAQALAEALSSPDLEMPPPLSEGTEVDPRRWLELIDGRGERLEAALGVVAREDRERSEALVERDRALAAGRQHYRRAANLLAAIFDYAGYEELAGRVRPTTRKARGEEAPPQIPPPPAA